jgi:hypothetical protein
MTGPIRSSPGCPAAGQAEPPDRPPSGRSRSETARIGSSWASLFSIPSVGWFTTPGGDSWHDPSGGGLCSSAASSQPSPRRGRRGVFCEPKALVACQPGNMQCMTPVCDCRLRSPVGGYAASAAQKLTSPRCRRTSTSATTLVSHEVHQPTPLRRSRSEVPTGRGPPFNFCTWYCVNRA